jgi:glycosyltransferase involved in cell wall biosynthesis
MADFLVGSAYQLTPPLLRRPFTWLKGFLASRLKGRVDSDLAFILLGVSSFPIRFLFGKAVALQPDDSVVLVDSTWNSKRMLEYLFRARLDGGVKLGAMIHDLFPFVLPETCQQETLDGFSSWFARIAPEVDFFVTNSEATRSTLADYLRANPHLRPYAWRAGSFPLGAELDLRDHEKERSDNVELIWNSPGIGILAVGTIEPRKNYPLLLDAFDLLHEKHLPVSLIIIGRPGWKSSEVMARIQGHPAFGSDLIHLDDASDFDLSQAFERADCLVCSSLGEGFGLPVVEGLMHGLTVFASDIPVFREIGGDACRYFPVNSPDALASLLTEWLAERIQRGKRLGQGFIWPNWNESTRQFGQLVLQLAAYSPTPGIPIADQGEGQPVIRDAAKSGDSTVVERKAGTAFLSRL